MNQIANRDRAHADQVDVPLCVDLDGTLLRTDTLWESLIRLLMGNLLLIFAVIMWAAQPVRDGGGCAAGAACSDH